LKKWLIWTQVANVWVGVDRIPFNECIHNKLGKHRIISSWVNNKTDTDVCMDKFSNADIRFSLQNITNCTIVEPYNICNEYIVNPCIGVSIIPNLTNVNVQDQIMPTFKFHSLLQKMNNKHLIFYDVVYQKNKIQMNQFIYSLLEVLVQVKFSH
jgi:hypothetical protein